MKNELLEKILSLQSEDKIAFMTIDGLQYGPIEDFVNQPFEGQLYDLNRDRASLYAMANENKNKRWVNDLALVYLLEYRCDQIRSLTADVVNLKGELNLTQKEVEKLKHYIVELTAKNEPKETDNVPTSVKETTPRTNSTVKSSSMFQPVPGTISM